MVAPVFESVGTGSVNGSATLVVTAPTGIQDGDLLVAHLSHGSPNLGADHSTVPSGFQLVGNRQGNSELTSWKYKKIASGESGNYTFIHPTANEQAGAIYRISGADATTPIDLLQEVTQTATNATIPLTGSTQVADSLLLILGACDTAAAESYTVDSGTERLDTFLTSTFLGLCGYTDAAASVTSYSRTITKAGAARRQQGTLLAIRPAAAAPIDLVINNLTQAQTLDNISITQTHEIAINALTQAQVLDNVVFTQVHELVINALTQAQVLDNLTIDSSTNLVIADLTQAQTLDNITITQVHELVINALTQAQNLDSLTITQVHNIVINALTQAQTLDNVTITQLHQLVIAALTQAQTLDNLTVNSATNLVIADLIQAQTLDNIALTQIHELVINALTQAQTLDNLTLTQIHQLVINALTQGQILSTLTIETLGALRPTIDVVAVALVRALTGIPASRVDTSLPKDTIIWADGFIQAVGISEESGMYVPLHASLINVSCWATNIGSGKPPWGKANQLAETLKVECLDHSNFPITLDLSPFGLYDPARVHTAYFVSEPHRIPSDEGSYARYDGELKIYWTPL